MGTPLDRPFRFAVQGGPFGDVEKLRAHARMVESLGYDELFTSDHIGAPGGGRKGGMFIADPFAPLLIVTEATERLRVGPLVLNNEFHNPALLARTAATVDRLSGGRLVLGIGTGYSAAEHLSIGQPIRPPGPRVARFEESLIILRGLLRDGSVDYAGEHTSASFDDVGISPVQPHVPFLIGGHGPRVVRLAARHADIFQFTGLTHGPDGTPSGGGFAISEVRERARWLEDAAGDRLDEIERSTLVQFTSCGPDAPSGEALSERLRLDPEDVDSCPFVLSGSVEQIIDKIGRLREQLGITHFVVRDAEGFAEVVDALTVAA